MNKLNKLKTLVAAMLLTTASAASAIGTYTYDNFTTELNGNVGIASSYEYRGLTLNDNPTVFANLRLSGTEGTLEGLYIGANGIAIDSLDATSQFTFYTGWQNTDLVSWQYGVGILAKITDYDDLNTNYGEVYGNVGYTWDNDYMPNINTQISYSDDYYNSLGSLVYYEVKGTVHIPTSRNHVTLYAKAGYSDSQDNGDVTMRDYSDFKVGAKYAFGDMQTNLGVTWISSKDDFIKVPFGTIDADDNATVNLTVSYNF